MRSLTVSALIAAALAAVAAPAVAQAIVCTPAEKHFCQPGSGCQPAQLGSWLALDPAKKSYERCDAKGCDKYQADVSTSGAYLTLELPGRAAFARIGAGGEFVETASLGLATVISFGSCRPS